MSATFFQSLGYSSPELATTVLKCHFLIEESVDAILEALAKSPEHLQLERTPSFIQKLRWIRAFGPIGDYLGWKLVLVFNRLRNKVAHKFDGPERKTALQILRKEAAFFDNSVLNEQEWDQRIVLGVAMQSRFFLAEVQDQVGKK